MGFPGRRVAISAPIVGYTSDSRPIGTAKAGTYASMLMVALASYVSDSSKRASTTSATLVAQRDQASLLVVRAVILALCAGSFSPLRVVSLKTDSPGRPPCRRGERV